MREHNKVIQFIELHQSAKALGKKLSLRLTALWQHDWGHCGVGKCNNY